MYYGFGHILWIRYFENHIDTYDILKVESNE